MKTVIAIGVAAAVLASFYATRPTSATAAPATAPAIADDARPWPEAYFEIFKLAPGKQEQFIRGIARADQVSAAGGQPPIQMFVHQDGGDWDVLLFKPEPVEKPTAAQQAAMDAKSKELQIESGPAYFVNIRETIASHTDTKTYGPISATQWLARLNAWRTEHPDTPEGRKAKK